MHLLLTVVKTWALTNLIDLSEFEARAEERVRTGDAAEESANPPAPRKFESLGEFETLGEFEVRGPARDVLPRPRFVRRDSPGRSGRRRETEEETKGETEGEKVFDKSKKFFELDAKSKSEASDSEGGGKKGYRGYFGTGGGISITSTARAISWRRMSGIGIRSRRYEVRSRAAGDFKDGFDCGVKGDGGDGNDACIKFFGKNIWPDKSGKPSITGFCETLTRYQAELVGGWALGQAADGA